MAELLPGEELNQVQGWKLQVDPSADLSEQYESGEFRIVTEQGRHQLPELANSITNGNTYNLQPDYQRGLTWGTVQQSRLIESFLMNIPVPPIFLYEQEYAKYEVMDGQQRLTAIRDFYSDRLILEGLELWTPLNGFKYSQLPGKIKAGIDRRYISSIILMNESARTTGVAGDIKQEVFSRINTGGISLNEQELRNARQGGALSSGIRKIVEESSSFKTLWGIEEAKIQEQDGQPLSATQTILIKRMGAEELALRFYVNRQRDALKSSGRLKEMLDEYWTLGNKCLSEAAVAGVAGILDETCALLIEVLGERAIVAFRQRNGSFTWVPRPSYLVYDTNTAVFSRYLDRRDDLISRKDQIIQLLERAYIDHYDDFDGRKTDNKDFYRRVEIVSGVIDQALSDE